MMPLYVRRTARITDWTAWEDGKEIPVSATAVGIPFLTALYRALRVDYPRFFKMDALSKLGFLASEILLREENLRFTPREDCAVICFSRSSSLDTDRLYQESIRLGDGYYPSPSLFVCTLPNIVTAEIAIRNKLHGETSVYICEKFNALQIYRTVYSAFASQPIRSALAGWTEYGGGACEAFLMQIETQPATASGTPFSVEFLTTAKHKP
jgi:3-oxoacyl-[acyl-carrier-protein] synthase-1